MPRCLARRSPSIHRHPHFTGVMDCGATTACLGTKRKAATASAAALDDGLSDGDDTAAAVVSSALPAPAAEAMRRPKEIMSQEWIDSVLADTIKPLPFKERHMRDPNLAAIFHSHERSRARFAGYQRWIRRELESKGYIEFGDDYDERCELLHAVHKAVFYGREDEEKEAMAKLAALRHP